MSTPLSLTQNSNARLRELRYIAKSQTSKIKEMFVIFIFIYEYV